MSDCAICIVSYNTAQLSCDCLRSVYEVIAGDGIDAEVWVLDNASSDGSADRVAETFPQVALLRSAENLGFAGGNNRIIDQIREGGHPPRHLLLLNSDTIVQQGALRSLVTFLDANPSAGVAGARLTYGDGSFQHAAFRFPTLAMTFFDFWPLHHRLSDSWLNGRYPRRTYERGRAFAIDHPLGAAMAVRWEVVEQLGAFDTRYFMYCEEIDWCMRIREAGWTIYCVPAAHVVHLGGQSARQFRERMFVALWSSRYKLFGRHYGPCYRWAVRRIVRAGLRREGRRVVEQRSEGLLDEDQAQARLAAFDQVRAM